MSEQAKNLDDLRRIYIKHRLTAAPNGGAYITVLDGQGSFIDIQEYVEKEFDQLIAQVRREAKIAELLEMASALRDLDPDGDAVFWTGEWYESVPEWILRRADHLEQEGKNDE